MDLTAQKWNSMFSECPPPPIVECIVSENGWLSDRLCWVTDFFLSLFCVPFICNENMCKNIGWLETDLTNLEGAFYMQFVTYGLVMYTAFFLKQIHLQIS